MRNYIILNGNNSNQIEGLLIQSLPPISKPLMRTAIEEIDGRDGDIVTNLGYSAYDKEVSIGLYGSYDVDEVIKYFSDNSKGQVTFSNEPDKYYNYEIINQIDFERLIRFKTAIVTLHCQPFKYPVNETPVEIAYQYVTNEAEEMDLDNTADAPMKLDLKGNTSQVSDPTPDSPVDINVVSGDNTIEICGKNLFDKDSIVGGFVNADGTIGGDTNAYRTSDFIPILPNTAYYKTLTQSPRTKFYNASKQPLNTTTYQDISIGGNSGTFTTPSNAYYLRFSFPITGGTSVNIDTIMVHKGSTASEYEPYTGQSHLIPLGVENLFDYSTNTDGKVLASNGAINDDVKFTISDYIGVLPNTNYTISWVYDSSQGSDTAMRVGYYQSDKTFISRPYNTTSPYTITTPNNCYYIRLCYEISSHTQIQTELGSKANSYTPYGTTPIELNKIGTYQDKIYKDNGKWYLHKEIGKVVLDGSNYPLYGGGGSSNDYWEYSRTGMTGGIGSQASVLTNYFNQTTNSRIVILSNGGLYFRFPKASGIDVSTNTLLNTWLSTHNTIVYYVLATPTNTEITDTTLLEQLENIANARSYDTSTHITQNANDKPFILNATALQKGSDTGVVDNDGNIYSKPTLDIEGTGTVGIYLNNNQMFSVDMSSSNECIIDVTNLEAYNPTTDVLMNRQVTGDYSNFTLPVGESQVKVSGNVTKATISNYVRWL